MEYSNVRLQICASVNNNRNWGDILPRRWAPWFRFGQWQLKTEANIMSTFEHCFYCPYLQWYVCDTGGGKGRKCSNGLHYLSSFGSVEHMKKRVTAKFAYQWALCAHGAVLLHCMSVYPCTPLHERLVCTFVCLRFSPGMYSWPLENGDDNWQADGHRIEYPATHWRRPIGRKTLAAGEISGQGAATDGLRSAVSLFYLKDFRCNPAVSLILRGRSLGIDADNRCV